MTHDLASDSAGTSENEAETAVVGEPVPAEVDPPGSATVGSLRSRYVVLEEIGRGGMGRVLRAYDPKLQREVAVKELRGDVLGEVASRRLVAEARAMAKLSHPNVVAVYDVEEECDQLVLVMEYVSGTTLRAWLREPERPWRDIVDRFASAGRGLAAAHAVGLLHRDFKPANVLVANNDGVKVTDFGLAKGAGDSSSWESGHSPRVAGSEDLTEAGVVLGTPRYMAPEQHRGESLTAAADQYGFCVALWEGLCGAAPFSGKHLVQKKSEGPPPWPTNSVPRVVAGAVRRGLSPDPERRWPSMEALLDALAYDPSKRRKRSVLVAAGVGVAGIAVVGWQTWATGRARRCTGAEEHLSDVWGEARRDEARASVLGTQVRYAERVWERTAAELDRYAADWAVAHIEACEATTVRGEQSAQVMDLRMACLQRAKLGLGAATAVLANADADVVGRAHSLVRGLRPLTRCANVDALQAEVDPPRPEEANAVAEIRALLAEANAVRTAGRYPAAQTKVEEAKQRLGGLEYGPVRVEVALAEGDVLEELGEYEASEAVLREALLLAGKLGRWEDMQDAASQLLFVVGFQQQRMDEGLRYLELAEGLAEGNPRATWAVRSHHAAVLHAQGKYKEAEAQYERALGIGEKMLGPEDLELATTRGNLAAELYAQGKYEESETEYRRVLELQEAALGPEHLDVATARNNLATSLAVQGEIAEAEVEQRRALTLQVELLGPEHPHVAMGRNNLANMLRDLGKYQEAVDQHRRAQAIWLETLGPDHPNMAASRNNLANTLSKLGKPEEAETEYRLALASSEKTLGPDHPDVAMSRNNIATILHGQGKLEEAEAEYQQALAIWEKSLGADHPTVATSRANLAGVLLERGSADEALRLAELAWDRCQSDGIAPQSQAPIAFVLARTLWATSTGAAQRERAVKLAGRGLEMFQEAGDTHTDDAEEVRAWLDTRRGP